MAVVLDGTNDFYLRSEGLRGAVDGKKGTFACWFRRDTIGTSQTLISLGTGVSDRFQIGISSGNLVTILGLNPAGAAIMFFTSATIITDTTKYHHLAISWDLGAGAFELFVDRVDDIGTITLQVDDVIDYTGDSAAVGAVSANSGSKFEGRIEEVFLDIENTIDLDSDDSRLGKAELGKFVSQDNEKPSGGETEYLRSEPGDQFKPVGYGLEASQATNNPPIVYLTGSSETFGINKGGGLRKNKGGKLGGDFVKQGAPTEDRGPTPYRKHARWFTPGHRWFESDRSGFLYPRGETFIERRTGIPGRGSRLGQDERDARTRLENPEMTFSRLVFRKDNEEDTKDERDV